MLITVVTSNWGQIYRLFSLNQKKTVFLDSTIECELRVYRQEMENSRR
jgi:hypothetical protein